MTEVILFHHAQGLTEGVRALADRLVAAGHTVHLPDLYDGVTFDSLEAGVEHAARIGFGELAQRGRAAAEPLPAQAVVVGISLGVLPAQLTAQTRVGVLGAVLAESCVPPEELGGPWPDAVAVQVHGMADDPFFAGEGDLDAARALVAAATDAELFLYPGDRHLFSDSSLASYDPEATEVMSQRVLAFLDRVSPGGAPG